MKGITFELVDSLPRMGNNGTLYLVPTVTEDNIPVDGLYNEYICLANEFVYIGNTANLTDEEMAEVKRGKCPNCGAPLNNVGHCDYCECF